MTQAPIVEVGRFINEQPFGRFQIMVALLCGLIVFMDGFDAQAMGFVAPALAAELGISRQAMGPLFSSGLAGMMIGALVLGALADRFGRKPILLGSTLIFGVGSLLCAASGSYEELFAYRFFAGLGMGGAMPNTIALTSEYTPKRLRATVVMVMFCGFSIGAAAGGFVSAALIEQFGWRSIFVVGGVLPLAIAAVAAALLPESVRFLVLKRGEAQRVARYLSKIAPERAFDSATRIVAEQSSSASGVGQLFAEGRTPITLLVWVMFFMSLLTLYFLNNWLPTIMTEGGIRLETAAIITALFQVGGTVGALTLGRQIDKRLSFHVLAVAYAGACVGVLAIGAAGVGILALVATIFVAGFFVIGGQTGSNALVADFYPTAIRSTGVGWALGIGRLGSILGPFLGGWLLSSVTSTRHIFWVVAIPSLIAMGAAFAVAALQRRTQAQPEPVTASQLRPR